MITKEQTRKVGETAPLNRDSEELKKLPDKRSEAKKAFDETRQRVYFYKDEITAKAKEAAIDRANVAVITVSDKIRNAEKAARNAAESLDGTQPEPVVNGVNHIADLVGNVAEYLETSDSRQITDDVRQAVRENSGVALGALVLTGFFAGRFLKATRRDK